MCSACDTRQDSEMRCQNSLTPPLGRVTIEVFKSGDLAERPLSTVSIREVDLLERPVAPDCEFKLSGQADSDVNLQLIKLDYESQCYRQSESILRARMERLQNDLKKNLNSSK